MSYLTNAIVKYSKKFLELGTPTKIAILSGTATTIWATKKLFFEVPNVPGLPKVSNLKGFAPTTVRIIETKSLLWHIYVIFLVLI